MTHAEALDAREEAREVARAAVLAREQAALAAQGDETARINREINAKKRADARDENGESKYARKRKFCATNGVWGFEVPEPKPWKKSAA